MHVIGSDGTSQFELLGGERIFSRPNTRILVKGARRAYKSKKDSDYKRLGKQVFKYLAKLTLERGCGRMEWSVLDWNAPSIQFYQSLGAKPMDEWTTYRLVENELNALI